MSEEFLIQPWSEQSYNDRENQRSGANECFVGTTFIEKNGLQKTQTTEKLTIHLADETVRVSNWVVKQGCVIMGKKLNIWIFL